MKVIFLDVDGVLNSLDTGGLYALKKPCLRRLQQIVEQTDANLVLSSTWRKYTDHVQRLKNVLSYRGMFIVSHTPVIQSINTVRGDEINLWLSIKKSMLRPTDTIRYVILDDTKDFLPEQLPFFVQTDGSVGLTDSDVEKAIHILNS